MHDGIVKVCRPFGLKSLVTPQFVPSKPSSQILNHPRPVTSVCVASGILSSNQQMYSDDDGKKDLLGHISHNRSQMAGVDRVSRIARVVAIRL